MTAVSLTRRQQASWRTALAIAATAAVLLLLMLRDAIRHVPLYDELLHVLAARGLLSTGAPVIAEGLYLRASLFTRLVAQFMAAFGDTLAVARLPALLAGALLVGITGAWVARRAGWLAGLFAALVLCAVPATQQLSVFARFYTLHAATILVMGMLLYWATSVLKRPLVATLLLILMASLIPLAWHLQESTAIAAGALCAGSLAVLWLDHRHMAARVLHRYPVPIVLALLLLAAGGVVALSASGLLQSLASTPLWAAGNASRPQYYLLALASDMPLLWPCFGLAAWLAWRSQPRFTCFCATVLISGLIVHSLAGAKSMRYVFYLMPFFCAIWGCALAAGFDGLRASGSDRRRSAALLLCIAVLALSQEGQRVLKLLGGKTLSLQEMGYTGEPDWARIVPSLHEAASNADRLVTSNAMKALYYFDRYDYELNASIVPETGSGAEFGTDARTGKQAIGTASSVAQLLRQPGSSLWILEDEKLGLASGVPAAAVLLLDQHCAHIVLPVGAEVSAWRCGTVRP